MSKPIFPPGYGSAPKAEIARIIAQELAWMQASPRKKPDFAQYLSDKVYDGIKKATPEAAARHRARVRKSLGSEAGKPAVEHWSFDGVDYFRGMEIGDIVTYQTTSGETVTAKIMGSIPPAKAKRKG
jgi:hypothetical protein